MSSKTCFLIIEQDIVSFVFSNWDKSNLQYGCKLTTNNKIGYMYISSLRGRLQSCMQDTFARARTRAKGSRQAKRARDDRVSCIQYTKDVRQMGRGGGFEISDIPGRGRRWFVKVRTSENFWKNQNSKISQSSLKLKLEIIIDRDSNMRHSHMTSAAT